MQRPRRRSFEQNDPSKERPISPINNSKSIDLPAHFYGLSSTNLAYSSQPNMNQLHPTQTENAENDSNISFSQTRSIPPPKDKKRHIFSRFKKKNRLDTPEISGTTTPISQTSSSQQPRKRSREQEHLLSTYPSTHSFDSHATDDSFGLKNAYNYYSERHGSAPGIDRRKLMYQQKGRRQQSEDVNSMDMRDIECT
ncbi:hypothetical protein BJ944DRAFT_242053 [Cunninghamella echinulata]|nr:hypothetical protein BJ944DRAFT_242053 [Cunninghamella echinulata]